MTIWSVDSSTLQVYLRIVQPGDTLSLAPGTYSGLSFKNLSYAQAVTITSADLSHQAVLTSFDVKNVSGLAFSNVELNAAGPVGLAQFNVRTSSDIHFDHVSVHGSLDNDPSNDAKGILVADSSNVSVTNSEFQQLGRASLTVLTSSNIKIEGNTVHDIQTDGFDFAQVDHISVSGNSFTNFHPATGDHPDAIQFWTTGTTAASHDIVVDGNVILRGDGDSMQGIFIRDGIGNLPFEHVTISNNLMYGTPFNGIRVIGSNDLTIIGNELLTIPGKPNWTKILVQTADHVTSQNNDASLITYEQVTNLVQSGDTTNPGVTDLGAAAMLTFGMAHPATQALLDVHLPVQVVAPDPGPLAPQMPDFGSMAHPFVASFLGPFDFSAL